MTLEYRGNRAAYGTRMAMICFNYGEEEKVSKIVEELKKDEYWRKKGFDWFDNCIVIPVIDKYDFNYLMEDYKKAKKSIA